jgi:predicted molibdopterin-dependent oxidoreductase YjgC
VPLAIQRLAAQIKSTIEGVGPKAVFFLGSATLSNEENFLLRKLADHLGCPNRDVVVDTSRVRKMKSKKGWVEGDHAAANYRGAREMGMTPGPGGYSLEQVLSGAAKPEIIVVGDGAFSAVADDAAKVAVLRRARVLAVASRTANALTRAADVLLPAASLAEKDGTFTNVQGRVQAFWRAFLPRPPIRPHFELFLLLACELGWGERIWTPEDVRGLIRAEVPAWASVTEEALRGGPFLKKGDFLVRGA